MKITVTSLLLSLFIVGCSSKDAFQEVQGEILTNKITQPSDEQAVANNELARLMVADRNVASPGWLLGAITKDPINELTLQKVSEVTVRLDDGKIVSMELDHYAGDLKQGDRVSVSINQNHEAMNIKTLIAKNRSIIRTDKLLHQRNTQLLIK
ncbi:hypothetical protein [Shewanella kaireitica]|uniref:hypothetical protein n=1 Tax=Shewanella kaireitica TaxID=212021 RepID=UPI00200FA748|nr:hypothetical protein [Shewanella kaireitica]MCL1096097.1 hypothetical protein [Shewanella kaireitica]